MRQVGVVVTSAGGEAIRVRLGPACHGGQRATTELLLDRGAELDWVAPWDGLTPLDAAVRSEADELAQWLRKRGARSAAELD